MNRQNLLILLCMLLLFPVSGQSNNREKYNFNPGWLLYIGDTPGAERTDFSDENWKKITLPRAFNEDEAFKVHIWGMTDTIAWYRKHFRLPKTAKGKKVFIEFEGVRQPGGFHVCRQGKGEDPMFLEDRAGVRSNGLIPEALY